MRAFVSAGDGDSTSPRVLAKRPRVMPTRQRGLVTGLRTLVFGLAGAALLTRFMASLLFGVTTTDPVTFIGVAALLSAAAVVASYLPARRATRVDPMLALRAE